jgi:hypothetical protein
VNALGSFCDDYRGFYECVYIVTTKAINNFPSKKSRNEKEFLPELQEPFSAVK